MPENTTIDNAALQLACPKCGSISYRDYGLKMHPRYACNGCGQMFDKPEAARPGIDERKYVCQDCRRAWTFDQLKPDIPRYTERVAPDEPEPAGECPECGAVCHEEPEPKLQSYHFDCGNSDTAAIGFAARVYAYTDQEALELLRKAVTWPVEVHPAESPRVEYLEVYFGAASITVEDIDSVDDVGEEEAQRVLDKDEGDEDDDDDEDDEDEEEEE